ncbi:hypothetical protein [Vibrio sp. TRT 29B02]|uniref:hypothetical protein n=1 Tax=Vibrio sp. TRT 29B02 TaxID=3418508 RepID=UPI003CEC4AF0
MTTFFRVKGTAFEYLVSDLHWKNLHGVESNSKYITQVDPLFKRYTSMGVRETFGKTMALGVVAKENEMPVEPQKGLSLAFAFRQHALLEQQGNPFKESDRHDSMAIYIAKVQDDSWSITGVSHGRITIDTAFRTKETDNENTANSSTPSALENNALTICEKIADQYLNERDAFNIRLTTIGLSEVEHDELIPLVKDGLNSFGDACLFDDIAFIPTPIHQFIDELGPQKSWFIGNIKRFNQKESRALYKYVGITILLCGAAYIASDVIFTKKPEVSNSVWDTQKTVSATPVPKPKSALPTSNQADEDRDIVVRLKQQEVDWYVDYIRKFGFNTAMTMRDALGSAPISIAGYEMTNASYERLHQVGKPYLGEVILLRYIRADHTARITDFMQAITSENQSIRVRDKDVALDGQTVVAVLDIPNPKLEVPFKINSAYFHLPSFIAELQSFQSFNFIRSWGIATRKENNRPHPIDENLFRSVQRHYHNEEMKEQDMLSDITTYRVTINSDFLHSFDSINQILQANQSALIEAFSYDVATSALTTEITVYDIN